MDANAALRFVAAEIYCVGKVSVLCISTEWAQRFSPFVSSSKWVYLQSRPRSQTATTVKCNQLQWLPPSSPANLGRYKAGREGDPRSAMSPRWIFPTDIQSRSLHSKCQRRGGESRASRSARWGVWCVDAVCLKMHVYTERQTHRLHVFAGPQCNRETSGFTVLMLDYNVYVL